MRRGGQFAVEVAIAQELGTAVQRILAGVVGDDAAGVDDDALNSGPLPIVAPERDVVPLRVALSDVSLPPTQGSPEPRLPALGCSILGFGLAGSNGVLRMPTKSCGASS